MKRLINHDNTLKQSLNKGKRLIIVHAGEEGFISNALLTWKNQSSSDDNHDNMNKDIIRNGSEKNYLQI